GLITQVDKKDFHILEKNGTSIHHFSTDIPLKDIVCLDVNSIDNNLFVHYLKQKQKYDFNELNLVEIYFDYIFHHHF
ncbi:hypothetical protein ABRY61_10720, partial [Lactobacillus helveticus]